MAGETGWTGRDFPSGPHYPIIIPSLGGTRGDPIYNETGHFLLLLDCFSATAIVV